MKTDDLIHKLSSDLHPVNRVLPPLIIFSGWILFSIFSVLVFIWSRSENFQYIHIPTYYYELIPIMLTLLFSAYAAIHYSIPGNRVKKIYLYLPILFILIWILSLIVRHLVNAKPNEVPYVYHGCITDFLFMSLPVATVLFYIINRRVPIVKNLIGFWMLAASAMISVTGISFLCPVEVPSHLFLIHLLPAICMSLLGSLLGGILFRNV